MPARKKRPGKCGTPLYVPPVWDPTSEERLLIAIFGRRPGKTAAETLAAMRAERPTSPAGSDQ